MKISIFQHHLAEVPGLIKNWSSAREVELETIDPKSRKVLAEELGDGVILMGGPMGVYELEKYPWLAREIDTVREYIDTGKKILGICLGAQIIAAALGAKVYRHKYSEIGWFPVRKTKEATNYSFLDSFEETLNIFFWHGDTFDLPEGATRVFENDVTTNQGFVKNQNVLALQFHPEVDLEAVQKICKAFEKDIVEGPFTQSVDTMLEETQKIQYIKEPFYKMLDQFFL